MVTVQDRQSVFLRLYSHAIAEGEASMPYLAMIHRRLEQCGTDEGLIASACAFGLSALRKRQLGQSVVTPPLVFM